MQDGKIIQNIFGTRSNQFHSRYIRPIQKLYTFTAAKEYEAVMDKTLTGFSHQLETRFMEGANQGVTCDIADWVSYLTWDILGEMTFSKPFGFMETATDVGGMLATAERTMDYQSVVSPLPFPALPPPLPPLPNPTQSRPFPSPPSPNLTMSSRRSAKCPPSTNGSQRTPG